MDERDKAEPEDNKPEEDLRGDRDDALGYTREQLEKPDEEREQNGNGEQE